VKFKSPALAHLFVIGLTFLGAQNAWAVCMTSIKGPVAIAVKQCVVATPDQTFATRDSKYNFIRDLPPENRKKFIDSYRGILVTGNVAQSQAIRDGISEEKGALVGEDIVGFIPQGAGTCEQTSGRTIEVQLNQSCCDGGGATPCLYDTSYVLTQVKVTDTRASGRAAAEKRSPEAQAIYGKVARALNVRDLKTAAAELELLRNRNELDANGQFQLATIYREMDKCPKAMPMLESLQKIFESKTYWTDNEAAVRKGSFLYARCLSMLGKSSEAVLILQGFLVEKTRYRKEIKDSLFHRDFGYIRTSKSYMKYKASAERALAAPDN